MTTTLFEPDQKQAIETEIAPIIQEARSFVVKSAEQKSAAVQFIDRLKALKVKIEERFHPTANREKALRLWQDSKDTEKAFYTPIDGAIETVKGTVKQFNLDESIKAQKEAAAAEAKRLEIERKEREKLEAQAKKAEEKGKVEKAESLREQAEVVTAAPVFTPTRETKNLVWKARVTNMMKLCTAVSEGLVPWNVLEIRQAQLNAFAKGYDGKTEVPGLQFIQDVSGRI